MKQYWQRISLRIDALSLRERAMVFLMAALVVITLINTVLLDPLFSRQKLLSQQMAQEQTQIASIQAEIQQKVRLHTMDPDAANRARLQQLKQQAGQLHASLQDMQKGLVSSDRMAAVLEDILRRNGKLRLVSLKTLPPASLNESDATESKSVANKPAGPGAPPNKAITGDASDAASVYRHGVEITVQGGYPDLMNYMAELEMMPWQLFWGKAKLNVEEYPKTTLTLTLFTLSLDKKWLNI